MHLTLKRKRGRIRLLNITRLIMLALLISCRRMTTVALSPSSLQTRIGLRRPPLVLSGRSSFCSRGTPTTATSASLTKRKTTPAVTTTIRFLSSSYEDDDDDNDMFDPIPFNITNLPPPPTSPTSSCSRYSQVLSSVGLTDQISLLSALPSHRQIRPTDVFCNRELKLGNIRAIGFDMDYTLAQYNQPDFDRLAFDGAKEKLVKVLGYPEEVLDFQYDHEFWVRGLIIDTQRGNFLKIDRHKYVRVAYHGFDPISSRTRKYLYSRAFNKVPSFTEKQYVNVDTLFQLVDAHLFASLVNMKDKGDYSFLDMKTYGEIYKHMRECIDLCHRDGVIKDEVARFPEKYLVLDDELIPMLRGFREAGTKVFLLTNSYWEYTSVAMNYLFHGKDVDDATKKRNEWLDLFDIVIVGSCKPAYLIDPYLDLFRVRPEDGSLLNTDGLFEIQALLQSPQEQKENEEKGISSATQFLSKGKTFQGGNWQHLNAMLEVEAGEEILYVGDHLYADVLRSKRTLGWRSAFVVPEIEDEMRVFQETLPIKRQITELRMLRDELSAYVDTIQNDKNHEHHDIETLLQQLERDDIKIKSVLSQLTAQYHKAFHPVWGQMFQAGYQDSRFAYFVQNYACLYTSKATNLGLANVDRSFRTGGEMLPHDKLLAHPGSDFMWRLEGCD